jgi:RNase P subunit RPR2
MDKICGACSKQENMTKEERIQLAMSRLPNTIYTCPLCNEKHSYSAQEQVPITPVEPAKEVVSEPVQKTKSKKTSKPAQEQLALF